MSKKNHHVRVGEEFNQELEFIKDERLKLGKDKKRISTRRLTNLITKHSNWLIIKKDIIEHENIEFEKIKDQRLKLGIDTKRLSTEKLTNLIIKHNSWPIIKKDIIKVDLKKVKGII